MNQITENPLFSLVLALVAFLLIFLILKSLFRITLFIVSVFLLYAAYVYFFQGEHKIPEIDQRTVDKWVKKVGDYIPTDINLSLVDSNFTRSKD